MPRKYAGPLQPGKRSAYVPGTRVNRPSFRRFAAKKVARKAFTKSVSNIIRKHQEKKVKVFNVVNTANIKGSGLKYVSGSSGDHSGELVSLLSKADIKQGFAQDQRVGNRISNVYLNIRGVAHSLPYDSTTNDNNLPYELHILAFKNKWDRTGDFAGIKQGLNDATDQIDGGAMSSLRPFNKDKFIIKFHKVLKLNAMPETISGSSGSNVLNGQVGRNPVMRRFSYRVPVAKTLVYTDAVASDQLEIPQNDWCSLAFYIVNGNGELLAITKERCQVQCDGYLTYTDA